MNKIETDILVSGGGIAGLAAAYAFGQAGFKTICVDPTPPVVDRDTAGADLRSTALLQPARDFLDHIGLWSRLDDHASPLDVMRIIDAGGANGEARLTKDFVATDISDRPFGWNVPNWLLRREMVAALTQLDTVDFRSGCATKAVLTRQSHVLATLSDSTQIRAKLIIAADGRASFVRQAVGIDVQTKRYGQKALAFAVTHPIPHEQVSTEIHRTGGPFTLVPLPDHKGRPSSAVVWMESGPNAQRLFEMDPSDFEAAMSERSCHVLGPLTLASDRSIWPIISQIADQFHGQRVALIAEAAHVVPPIGAQGLNMSLGDVASLLALAQEAPDAGDAALLERYHKSRYSEVKLRVTGVDALNRASMMSAQPMRDLRALGLQGLHAAGPVRKTLMKLGLGTSQST
ncbi:UbiH/UbiF family hydroxylase [Algirhabdus cladophorae]|uniref:UbiH/UbiF family hydroxylase n=1 Tax=Algirhabdus cladophorae TaxID=3377108 RepID=UPI003B84A9F7